MRARLEWLGSKYVSTRVFSTPMKNCFISDLLNQKFVYFCISIIVKDYIVRISNNLVIVLLLYKCFSKICTQKFSKIYYICINLYILQWLINSKTIIHFNKSCIIGSGYCTENLQLINKIRWLCVHTNRSNMTPNWQYTQGETSY